MTFSILIAEDEPAAQRHLVSIIGKKNPGFRVIGVAEDGVQAFDMVKELGPDVLISDIRMPRMDGIELIGKVKEEFPEIVSVIISGYQDFEYAKNAIRSEVMDYLLKPISIPALNSLLDQLMERLTDKAHTEIGRNLSRRLNGRNVPRGLLAERLMMAVVRKNGLHSRFSSFTVGSVGKDVTEALVKNLNDEEKDNIWLIPGRDGSEWYVIAGAGTIHYSRFKAIVDAFGNGVPECRYYTAALSVNFDREEVLSCLAGLQKLLWERTVPGVSRILYDDSPAEKSTGFPDSLDSTFFRKIDGFLMNRGINSVRREIRPVILDWTETRMPLASAYIGLKNVLGHLLQYCPLGRNAAFDMEQLMDEAFMECVNYSDLAERFDEILEGIGESSNIMPTAIGSRELVERITKYIECHLADEISIPHLCRTFGISQSYLNRMFHRYRDTSVVEFIRDTRISRSIELMKESPAIPLKEIAVMVGYEDASYFSKVFKATHSISPREFRESLA